MKRVYVNEKWCLGCRLCEYYCAFADTGEKDMARALKNIKISPRIKIEEKDGISFAVNCRHCNEPLCVKGCITGGLSVVDGVVSIDKEKCVSCYTCVLCCPFGAVATSKSGAVQKCELCVSKDEERSPSSAGTMPACVKGCPNAAIVYEERGTSA